MPDNKAKITEKEERLSTSINENQFFQCYQTSEQKKCYSPESEQTNMSLLLEDILPEEFLDNYSNKKFYASELWFNDKPQNDTAIIKIQSILTNEVMPTLEKFREEQSKHDTKMTKEHQQMLQKLESENAYFRKQLAEINTPIKLQKSAFLFGTMSFISLGIGKLVGINLLHPIVAYFIFGISTVFYIMATMMKKQEKK